MYERAKQKDDHDDEEQEASPRAEFETNMLKLR